MSLSPDGVHYAVSLLDSVEVWKIDETSQPLYSIQTSGQNRIDFSTDGELIAIAKLNGDLEVRNLQSGDILQTFKIGISKQILQIIFSPDHLRVYTINRHPLGYSLMRWNLSDGSNITSR